MRQRLHSFFCTVGLYRTYSPCQLVALERVDGAYDFVEHCATADILDERAGNLHFVFFPAGVGPSENCVTRPVSVVEDNRFFDIGRQLLSWDLGCVHR